MSKYIEHGMVHNSVPNIEKMDSLTVFEYENGTWKKETSTWDALLQGSVSIHTRLIFAATHALADLSDTYQDSFLQKFHVNPMLIGKTCLDLNGFAHSECILDQNDRIAHHNHWSRFIIKQTHAILRPKASFNAHRSTLETTEQQEKGTQRSQAPIHDERTQPFGWTWYEMSFFVHWTPPHATMLLCFGVPEHLQSLIQSTLLRNIAQINTFDPYILLGLILNEVIAQYNDSVWSMRNHISRWEAERYKDEDYSLLHEIARHVIHVNETITVATRSVQSLQQQCQRFMEKHFNSNHSPDCVHNVHAVFDLQAQILQNLLARSESVGARVQNEISLAFNIAAQRDSKIQVQIAQESRREASTMKAIALLTMTFLPATFLSTEKSLFCMPFFQLKPNQNGTGGSFVMSSQFWIYWATVIPLTVMTIVTWAFWDKTLLQTPRKGKKVEF